MPDIIQSILSVLAIIVSLVTVVVQARRNRAASMKDEADAAGTLTHSAMEWYQKLEAKLVRAQADIQSMRCRIQELEDALEQKDARIAELEKENHCLQDKVEHLTARIRELEKKNGSDRPCDTCGSQRSAD